MPKKDDATVELSPEQAVEQARDLAQKLAEQLEKNEEAEELYDDSSLLKGAELLTRPDVPFETVARLARSDSAAEKYIALTAIDRRRDATPEWVDATVRRLHAAWENELAFLLRTLAAARPEPLIARVLLQADTDWVTDPNLRRVVSFVHNRTGQGELLEGVHFEGLVRGNVELSDEFVGVAHNVLPEQVVAAYRRWSRTEFVRPFATVWQLPPPGESPALVGERDAVLAGLEAVLSQITSAAGSGRSGPRRSVLLVGEHGVGKSSLLREAVRRFAEPDWIVFEAAAQAVMAGQVYIGELEGRVHDLIERSRDWPMVWVLPSLEEALYAGQHSRSPQGLLDAILPHVESGELVIVGELTPQALDGLLKERPQLATAFTAIRVGALDEADTRAAARAWATGADVDVSDEVLGEAQELAAHYLSGVSMPGALLRLLRAAARRERTDEDEPVRLDGEAVIDTLADATGLPLHILDPRSALDLGEVRSFLERRVLGQPDAVDCLVERIALIKAGLTDPTRPLGVFLFVGPTGTGKTELAKALAEYVFGSADRLVRLDMSEFQTPASLERLLSDRATEPQAAPLIAAVRQNPFSVILLDEFEKAHENVWDVFLQVFDDGRLTDRSGSTTDFRHCVVILTSNTGSAIAPGPGTGFASEAGAFRVAAVERAVTHAFRPELLNRLDRVVVFGPLERKHMRRLLEHELQSVMERRGLRSRGWVVESDDAALDLLLDKGFSRELGARPLKRAVEREVLAPLARAIVGRAVPEGDQFLVLTARDGAIDVSFVDPDAEEAAAEPTPLDRGLTLERIVADPRGDPAEVTFLREALARARLDAWAVRKDELLARTRVPAFWDEPGQHRVLAAIEVLDRADAMTRFADDLLIRIEPSGDGAERPSAYLVGLLADRIYLLERARSDAEAGLTGDAFVSIRAPDAGGDVAAGFAADLHLMLEAWSERRGMRLTPLGEGMFAVAGLGAHAILAPEAGLHVLELPGRHSRSFARATVQMGVAAWPAGLTTEAELRATARTALAEVAEPQQVVRRYRRDPSPLVRDTARGRTGRLDRGLGGEFDVVP